MRTRQISHNSLPTLRSRFVGAAMLVCCLAGVSLGGTFASVGTHPDAALQSTDTGKSLAALTTFNGKIYAGYGDYSSNTGPIGIRAFDPATNTFSAQLLSSTTEAVYLFREIDGKMYAPTIDPKGSKGGYALGTASGNTETWVDVKPINMTHVWDVVSYNGALWMCGELSNKGQIYSSVDNGATWQLSLNVPQPTGGGYSRFYGMGVYDGKLYAQVNVEHTNSRVFDGTSWSNGPNLIPNSSGIISRGTTFAGRMIYQTWESGLPSAYPLAQFDGTTSSLISSDPVFDYAIDNGRLYTLVAEYNMSPPYGYKDTVIKWTDDLVTWHTLDTALATFRSLTILDNHLYLGATNSQIYEYSDLVPEPATIVLLVIGAAGIVRRRRR